MTNETFYVNPDDPWGTRIYRDPAAHGLPEPPPGFDVADNITVSERRAALVRMDGPNLLLRVARSVGTGPGDFIVAWSPKTGARDGGIRFHAVPTAAAQWILLVTEGA